MSPYWLNNTCSPYTSQNASCILGNIASYAINVSSVADVVAGLEFARQNNVRLSIKNTGHDYIGRSNGEGSLALWTHNLKDITFFNYSSGVYTGPAAKVSAGVQFFEAYATAASHGLRVVGGFCPTVGMAGGYVQGAGHGPLGATYGLAADNTLEFEVALSGGGGGTYGIVLSLTTKAHPDGQVAGGSLAFDNTNEESFWAAIEKWQSQLLLLDRIPGFTTVWGFTNASFSIAFATLPGGNASTVADALSPFLKDLDDLGIVPSSYETSDRSNFYEHYEHYTGDMPYGPYTTNDVIGGRLIQRSTIEHNVTNLVAVLRDVVKSDLPSVRVNGIAANVTHARAGNSPGDNAVLPAWRESLYWLNVDVLFDPASSVSDIRGIQAQVNSFQDRLKPLTPGGGAYMNEGTYDNVDWKTDYYGSNYEKLLQVKKTHDPDFLLYSHTSVGADEITVASDGRICKH
ncbi:FAD-linked oxidoreductase ZEB1 [Colletotrichum sp. SAR 10_99]|nr:FAD-linked oxidoreductase ZEB1 [Colletotrichum sp. SAR 10_96]KAJ5015558.1 FAD-linked oxidoreductase ZEB1 [Colletotrichum sp. SAR 10_99]